MLRTLLKGTTLLVGLIAAVMMIGCAGVTPSILVGITHTPLGDGAVTAKEVQAWAWSFGGTLKATFRDTGTLIEPCGHVQFSGQSYRDGDVNTTAVPGQFCLEFDVAKLRGARPE